MSKAWFHAAKYGYKQQLLRMQLLHSIHKYQQHPTLTLHAYNAPRTSTAGHQPVHSAGETCSG
jgi:hypothetical protein